MTLFKKLQNQIYLQLANQLEISPTMNFSATLPMDLSVNKKLKDTLRREWTKWYGNQIKIGLQKKIPIKDIRIDTTLGVLKPVQARCVLTAYNALKRDKQCVIRGWKLMGLSAKSKKKSKFQSNDDEKQE